MRKSFVIAEVKALDGENPDGEFEAVLSAPTLDRDGEIIDGKAFEKNSPLPASIPIHINHEFDVEKVVGRGVPFYEGDVLKVRGVFDPDERSQLVRAKVKSGSVNRMSVGFMGAKREQKNGVPHVTAAELLEGSFVSVSSNRDAAVDYVKSFKAGARNNASDATRLQQIHDLAVENGAACMKAATADDTKAAVAGSYEQVQEELREALQVVHADDLAARIDFSYLYINATFEDRVVYTVCVDGNDDAQWSRPYTFDGEDVTLGDATPVEIEEVVNVVDSVDATKKVSLDVDDAEELAELALKARALRQLAHTHSAP